uniref:Uncharacterized protein n=1 Tax=Lepeophtheirus salmonis TaxID=72036 RepID=A0A0K2VGX2_LEPSM
MDRSLIYFYKWIDFFGLAPWNDFLIINSYEELTKNYQLIPGLFSVIFEGKGSKYNKDPKY